MAEIASSELNLRELRILNALLHERSITRTAQLLATTQPGISKVLRHLRTQFADPLFVRNGHAMQPTAKALEICRSVARAAWRRRQPARRGDGLRSRPVGPHVQPAADRRRNDPLPAAADRPGRAPSHRRVNIRAMPLDSRQFELKLEAGEADLALGAFPKAARHLRRQRLYFDGYVTVVRNGHPRISALRSRAGFLAERHILVTASETGHAAHGTAQRVLTVADTAVEYHAAGPELHRRRHRCRRNRRSRPHCRPIWPSGSPTPLGLIAFETPITLPRIEISQYWHERYHRDAAHRWFRSVTFRSVRRNGVRRSIECRIKPRATRSPPPRTIPR